MSSWWRSLAHAVQFMTLIPMPSATPASNREQGRAVLFYPLVGLVIGGLLTLLAVVVPEAHPAFMAALTLALWVVLTGGLHLDGLADSADAAMGGYGDRQRSLDIMKDPRSGPIAIVAVVLVLLLKYSALLALFSTDFLRPALLIIPVLGRVMVIVLLLTTAYVRPSGIGAASAANLPRIPAVAIIVFSLMATIVPFRLLAVWLALAVIVMTMLLRAWMVSRIGGTTGDTIGAVIELTEASALTVAVLLVAQ